MDEIDPADQILEQHGPVAHGVEPAGLEHDPLGGRDDQLDMIGERREAGGSISAVAVAAAGTGISCRRASVVS
ncbi:hypothetical protein, partial [Rhodoplanes serenus]|uniref:hypothetical protein n=1 Tax=Rhodoplanes serenus TaxID=200615 RepID=UPI001AECFCCE